MTPGLRRKLLRRIDELKTICAETYQVVGILADEAERFDDPVVTKALDNLAAMRHVHDDVLPFPSGDKSPDPVHSHTRTEDSRTANHIDGFDRDDLGESPD